MIEEIRCARIAHADATPVGTVKEFRVAIGNWIDFAMMKLDRIERDFAGGKVSLIEVWVNNKGVSDEQDARNNRA